jgi:hypothetical protein
MTAEKDLDTFSRNLQTFEAFRVSESSWYSQTNRKKFLRSFLTAGAPRRYVSLGFYC